MGERRKTYLGWDRHEPYDKTRATARENDWLRPAGYRPSRREIEERLYGQAEAERLIRSRQEAEIPEWDWWSEVPDLEEEGGENVFFSRNEYTPETEEKPTLLVHEPDTRVQRTPENKSESVEGEKEEKDATPRAANPFLSGEVTGEMRVSPSRAAEIGHQLLAGKPGLLSGVELKFGGSSFFVTKGDPYIGFASRDQNAKIPVRLRFRGRPAIYTDVHLLEMHAKILEENFIEKGARIPAGFRDALVRWLQRSKRNWRHLVAEGFSHEKLGISNTLFGDLTARGNVGRTEALMWFRIGEATARSPSGVSRVIMGQDSHVSRNRPGEFFVINRPEQGAEVIGGGDAIHEAMVGEAGQGTPPNLAAIRGQIQRNIRFGQVRSIFRVGSRVLLAVGVAQDAYAFIRAESKLREASRIAGGWSGGLALGATYAGTMTALFGPADALGPVAWVLHGLGAFVAFSVGYFVGSGGTQYIYDLVRNSPGRYQGGGGDNGGGGASGTF